MSFSKAVAVGMLPFLIGDALKIAAAIPIARALRPMIDGTFGAVRAVADKACVIIQTATISSHRFADGTAGLKDVTLTFDEGEFTVIAGANGSGKTTLLRHLNGLLFPESGSVTVCGKSVRQHPLAARQQVGMVFQDADSQIVGETVYDDAAFGPENLALARDEIDQRVNQALAAVGSLRFENKQPHHLSGGEKRRLAIAGVLAMAPRVLLMDEPFSNLDYPATCRCSNRSSIFTIKRPHHHHYHP
jgi:biotin transport system ATP-binding protein